MSDLFGESSRINAIKDYEIQSKNSLKELLKKQLIKKFNLQNQTTNLPQQLSKPNNQISIKQFSENYNKLNQNNLLNSDNIKINSTGQIPEFNQLSSNPKPVNYPQPSYGMNNINDYQYKPIPSLTEMQKNISIHDLKKLHNPPSIFDVKKNIKVTTVKKNIDLDKSNFNSSSINNTGPQYVPEISKKRTIGNIVYNNIIKSFNNIKKHHIAEYEIDHLLQKYNIIDDKGIIDKTEITSFVKELKQTISENSNKEKDLIIQEDTLFEKETKDIDYLISIDSSDRDKQIWKNPSHYRINFGPDNNLFNSNDSKAYKPTKGYINRTFNNIKSIELLEAIIPKCLDKNGTDLFIYPYLILEIEEFGSMYEGTNNTTNKAFARLNFDKIIGNYRFFKADNNNKIIKFFNPRIALNRITLKLTKPNGELIDFGKSIILDSLCNSSVSFDIKQNKKIYDLSNNNKNACNSEKKDILDDDFKNDLCLDENNDIVEENVEPCWWPNQDINTISEDEGAIFNSFIFKITCIQRSLDTMYLDKRDG